MAKKTEKPKKLNAGLDPGEFKICVPTSCELFDSDWTEPSNWREYVKSLYRSIYGRDMPPKGQAGSYRPVKCCSCYCEQTNEITQGAAANKDEASPSVGLGVGWLLEGDLAVAHACRVHEKIHRQVLALDQVSAVDVGFAISESEKRFEKYIAIRVHVNKKMPPEQLLKAGLVNLTMATWANGLGSRVARGRTNAVSKSGLPRVVTSSTSPPQARLSFGVPDEQIGMWSQVYGFWKSSSGLQWRGESRNGGAGDESPQDCCEQDEGGCDQRFKQHLDRLFREAFRRHTGHFDDLLNTTYPVTGIRREDLSLFCPKSIEETRALGDIRLCICGVSLDIVNAQYNPAITHPGGDANSGVFTDSPRPSTRLSNEEVQLIGRGRVNPLVGGVSVGTVTGQAGTLGTIVWDKTDATPCILSNWHVLAGRPTAQVGQPTYQPALFDGGDERDAVAHLKRWYLGEEGDAALSELAGNRHYAAGEILGLWNPVSGYVAPRLNLEVRKLGRTTGFTEGFIDGICLATNIDYGNEVVRYFRSQFHIAPLYRGKDVSQVGDSGSLVVTRLYPVRQQWQLGTVLAWLQASCDVNGTNDLCDLATDRLEELAKKDAVASLKNLLEHARDEIRALCRISGVLAKIKTKENECFDLKDFLQKEIAALQAQHICTEAIATLRNLGNQASNNQCDLFFKAVDARIKEIGEKPPAEDRCDCQVDQLCKALYNLLKSSNEAANPPLTLRDFIRSHSEIVEKLRRGLRHLEKLVVRCEESQLPPTEACGIAMKILAEINTCLVAAGHETCGGPLDSSSGAEPTLAEFCVDPAPVNLCLKIQDVIRCGEGRIRELENQVGLATEAVIALASWHQRSCEIRDANSTAKAVCAALRRVAASNPDLRDPSEWVERMIEEMESPARSSSGPGDADKSEPGTKVSFGNLNQANFLPLLMENLQEQQKEEWFQDVIRNALANGLFAEILIEQETDFQVMSALFEGIRKVQQENSRERNRQTVRANYAVGLIFAGDTPGSPFGEFAVASDIQHLEEELRFSLRPVFEPRSSFRELRVRPDKGLMGSPSRRSGTTLTPGEGRADPEGGGPQPEIAKAQDDSGNG